MKSFSQIVFTLLILAVCSAAAAAHSEQHQRKVKPIEALAVRDLTLSGVQLWKRRRGGSFSGGGSSSHTDDDDDDDDEDSYDDDYDDENDICDDIDEDDDDYEELCGSASISRASSLSSLFAATAGTVWLFL